MNHDIELISLLQEENSKLKLELEDLRKLALASVDHYYEGGCPNPGDADARDPACPACKILGAPKAKG